MNKSIIAVAVAAAFACMGTAQAFEMGPYVGVKSGLSHMDISGKDISIEGLNNPEHAISDSSLYSYTGGVFAGYNFNPYFGVEFGYDYLGTFDMDFSADNMGSHDFTVNALQLSLRGAYPITSSLSVTGTVGALQWFNDAWSYDRHQDGGSEDQHSSMSPVVGAGFEYAFNRNWVARFDYEYIHRVGSRRDNGITPDISTYNVGLEYVFDLSLLLLSPLLLLYRSRPSARIIPCLLTFSSTSASQPSSLRERLLSTSSTLTTRLRTSRTPT